MKRLVGGLLLVSVISSWGLQAAQSAAVQNQEEVVVAYQDAPLIQAVLNGDVDAVACLLADPSVDPNVRNHQGRTAFMLTAFAPYHTIEIMDLFLARDDVAVNAQDNDGNTAVMLCVLNDRHSAMYHLSCSYRIDMELRNNEGRNMIEMQEALYQESRDVRAVMEQELILEIESMQAIERLFQEERALREERRLARELARANKENIKPSSANRFRDN